MTEEQKILNVLNKRTIEGMHDIRDILLDLGTFLGGYVNIRLYSDLSGSVNYESYDCDLKVTYHRFDFIFKEGKFIYG